MSRMFFYFRILREKCNKYICRIQMKKNFWKFQLWFEIHFAVSQGIGSNACIWFLCLSKPTHMPDWTPVCLTFSLLNSVQHNVAYWKKSTQMTQPVMQAFFSVEFFIFFLQNENGPHYLRINKSESVSSNNFLCIGYWSLTKNSWLRSCFLPKCFSKYSFIEREFNF